MSWVPVLGWYFWYGETIFGYTALATAFPNALLILLIGVGTGVSIGLLAGFTAVSCLLLGALMATHTPLGYPIVRSYGAQKDESVVVSVGSTIFTDIVALLLLAVGLGLGQGDLNGLGLGLLLVKIGLFALIVVVGIRWRSHPPW